MEIILNLQTKVIIYWNSKFLVDSEMSNSKEEIICFPRTAFWDKKLHISVNNKATSAYGPASS